MGESSPLEKPSLGVVLTPGSRPLVFYWIRLGVSSSAARVCSVVASLVLAMWTPASQSCMNRNCGVIFCVQVPRIGEATQLHGRGDSPRIDREESLWSRRCTLILHTSIWRHRISPLRWCLANTLFIRHVFAGNSIAVQTTTICGCALQSVVLSTVEYQAWFHPGSH